MTFVAYYRVSTKKQDLGLKAQQTIITNYLTPNDEIIGSFSEKETGTRKRVGLELTKAIELCKVSGATLLIAKLDRLARSVSFVSTLMDSKVEFKALDMPHANKMTIHIFSAMAQHEAELISTRTTQALAELKKKGVKLGNPQNFTQQGRNKGVETNKAKAKDNLNNKRAKAYATTFIAYGAKDCVIYKGGRKVVNYSAVAEKLNKNGFTTSRGKQFQTVQVQRLFNS